MRGRVWRRVVGVIWIVVCVSFYIFIVETTWLLSIGLFFLFYSRRRQSIDIDGTGGTSW